MRRATAVIVLLLALAAAPAAAAPSRFALAHRCAAVGGDPVRMVPTRLGSYLLYRRDRTFVTADGPTAAPGPQADWRVVPRGRRFVLRSASGALLGPVALRRARGCARHPDSDTDVSGRPSRGAAPWAQTRGLFESHLHWMAFEFLGGNAHCGRPWHPYGVAFAMVDCPDHEPGGAGLVFENALSGASPAATHDTTGWPTFRDWPRPTSLTHEGTYHRWVERAWRGGLRLAVVLFVDSGSLCNAWPSKRHGCNEMDSVRRQIGRLRALQRYVDAQAGGPGRGWLRIVTDPFQARRAINRGKLAVVLGIETSRLFDCQERNDVPTCTKPQIDERLAEMRRAGVRSLEVAVKTDNGFSGAAGDPGTNGIVTNLGNRTETGHFFDMETCTGDPRAADKTQLTFGPIAGTPLVTLYKQLDPNTQTPVYPPPPHCNRRGLTELGEHLVHRMADSRMLIDPDHMSARARIRALDLLEARGYSGVISSHSWSTPVDEPRILRLGGVVVPKAAAIAQASPPTWFVDEWKRLRALRDRRYLFGFGFGSDMNGVAKQPVADAATAVRYPFRSYDGRQVVHRATTGERTWDYKTDGVAQYGLYLDWLEDLRRRAGPAFVRDMRRGPEAYLQMWERAVGVPAVGPRPRAWLLRRISSGLSAGRLLRRAGQPRVRRARVWRWDVRGGGRVTVRLSARGRVVAVRASIAPTTRSVDSDVVRSAAATPD